MSETTTAAPPAAGAGRKGDWMITFTGRRFYPLDPRVEDVDFRDVAHALAHVCRYGGHVRRFYSVAEHSRLLAEWFEGSGEVELARLALLHDAPEAYIGDMVRPLKRFMPAFAKVEAPIERVIFAAAGLEGPIPQAVHDGDSCMIGNEVAELFGADQLAAADWLPQFVPLPGVVVVGDPAHRAERDFLHVFRRLFPGVPLGGRP